MGFSSGLMEHRNFRGFTQRARGRKAPGLATETETWSSSDSDSTTLTAGWLRMVGRADTFNPIRLGAKGPFFAGSVLIFFLRCRRFKYRPDDSCVSFLVPNFWVAFRKAWVSKEGGNPRKHPTLFIYFRNTPAFHMSFFGSSDRSVWNSCV